MIPMPLETRRALGLPNEADDASAASLCESRSLLLERFANPSLKKERRVAFFHEVKRRPVYKNRSTQWLAFLANELHLSLDQVLIAQLQARLLVNMSGGVMENAGLSLDRLSGLPFIPGSAVKGCARRAAIDELRILAALPAEPKKLGDMLTKIALVFGWTDQEWKGGRTRAGEILSDFESACGTAWESAREVAVAGLLDRFHGFSGDKPKNSWKILPNFAGAVNFLSAFPVQVQSESLALPIPPPPIGKLDLEVLTCHHEEYYCGNAGYDTAPDNEKTNPVVFPAVAAGHIFVFSVCAVRGQEIGLPIDARRWLKSGLRDFGLGAKTAAGYGWFEDVTNEVTPWWEMQTAVNRLRRQHAHFESYTSAEKDDCILGLAERNDLCRGWEGSHPISFAPIKLYADSQNIQLLV